MAIDFTSPSGQMRLLLNDVNETDLVFTDGELAGFLALEGNSVKRATAQALDVIASDEALTSKVIRTQDLATDGTKTAAALRDHAARLRAQADSADDAADEGFFQIVPMGGPTAFPELTERPGWYGL